MRPTRTATSRPQFRLHGDSRPVVCAAFVTSQAFGFNREIWKQFANFGQAFLGFRAPFPNIIDGYLADNPISDAADIVSLFQPSDNTVDLHMKGASADNNDEIITFSCSFPVCGT